MSFIWKFWYKIDIYTSQQRYEFWNNLVHYFMTLSKPPKDINAMNIHSILYSSVVLFFICSKKLQATGKLIDNIHVIQDVRQSQCHSQTCTILTLNGGASTSFITNPSKVTKGRNKHRPKKNPLRHIIGFLHPFKKSPQQLYTETLEQTINNLQIQIQTLREESRQLRSLLNKQQSNTRIGKAKHFQSIQSSEKVLRDQMKQMEVQIQELEKSKLELMELLEYERQMVAKQKEFIDMQQENIAKAERQFKEEMEKMRNSLLEQSKRQMKEMILSTDKKIQADAMKNQKITDSMIERERKKGEAAVEKEKEKMRKLVKALAERERKGKMEDMKRVQKLEEWKQASSNIKDKNSNQKLKKQWNQPRTVLATDTGGPKTSGKVETKKAAFGARGIKK